jgi:sterol desaturase/sphingolipid hydroxylase (fatty acid hydroxylase superfamily)
VSTASPPGEGDDAGRDLGAEPLPAYDSSRYASYPEGVGGGATPPPPAQPPSISRAVRLMQVGAALSVLSLVITLATASSLKSHLRAQLRQSNTHLSTSDFNTTYHVLVASAVVGSLIAAALWLWMAWTNGQGRAWARIVSTVLGVINLVSSVYTISAGRSLAIGDLLTVVDLCLAVVILVLLWRTESSDFYAASARAAR